MQRSQRRGGVKQRRVALTTTLENAFKYQEGGVRVYYCYYYYKVSLSLIFASWGIIFLLNLCFRHGHGCTTAPTPPDNSGSQANESTWPDTELQFKNGSISEVGFSHESIHKSDAITLTTNSKTDFCSSESPPREEHETNVPPYGEKAEVDTYPTFGEKTVKENPQTENLPRTEVDMSASGTKKEKETPKSEKLSRVTPLGLDEFKSRASSPKGKPVTGRTGTITHRLETGGAEHNYASASKGAKVLVYNKEAKGASNILGKDEDKYLRNPCSAEEKFVIIELSEETLVDTIEIANFEHHSSNLKDFELLGSLVYPTDRWVSLGNFTAGNVKHAQRFILQDPKWVRYLKLNLLSHHGSEFYCTVSYFEVYGVDAVERMLEDLISDQDHSLEPEHSKSEPTTSSLPVDTTSGDELHHNHVPKIDDDSTPEKSSVKYDVPKNKAHESVHETWTQQGGRLPGDTALKILMQKVRSLDLNLLILERYLEELNSRYGSIFKDLDAEIDSKDQLVEKMKSDLKSCADNNEVNSKDVAELISWKSLVSSQMDNLLRDNTAYRSEVETVLYNQRHMESKGLLIFLLCCIFGGLAFTKLFLDMVVSLFRIQNSRKFCGIKSSWLLLLLSCTIIVVILVL